MHFCGDLLVFEHLPELAKRDRFLWHQQFFRLYNNELFAVWGHPKVQKEFDALRKAMTDALKGEEAIPGFGYLPEQVHLFSEQFQGNRECYETGTLAANFDIPRLIEMFFACTPAQMDEVRYAFVRSFRSSNIGEFLSGDKDALTQLRDGIIAGVNNYNLDCVQKLQSEWFAENLNEIIRKLH